MKTKKLSKMDNEIDKLLKGYRGEKEAYFAGSGWGYQEQHSAVIARKEFLRENPEIFMLLVELSSEKGNKYFPSAIEQLSKTAEHLINELEAEIVQ